jgi:hypothetical protein
MRSAETFVYNTRIVNRLNKISAEIQQKDGVNLGIEY